MSNRGHEFIEVGNPALVCRLRSVSTEEMDRRALPDTAQRLSVRYALCQKARPSA